MLVSTPITKYWHCWTVDIRLRCSHGEMHYLDGHSVKISSSALFRLLDKDCRLSFWCASADIMDKSYRAYLSRLSYLKLLLPLRPNSGPTRVVMAGQGRRGVSPRPQPQASADRTRQSI